MSPYSRFALSALTPPVKAKPNTRQKAHAMAALLPIVLFVVAFAAINFYEFGRFD
jgi:hypothetical protein